MEELETAEGTIGAEETEVQVDTALPEEAEPNPSAELWGKIVPELADTYEELSPERREGILLKRIDAMLAEKAANGGEGKPTTATDTVQPPAAPIPEVPPFSVQEFEAAVQKGFEDADAGAVIAAFKSHFDYTNAIANLTLNMTREQDNRLDRYERPNKFKALLPKVRGSEESDVDAAEKILDSGEAKTPEAALKLAVFNRMQESEPSEDARRKARSVLASGASAPSRRPGQSVRNRIPETEAEWMEEKRREAEESRRKK